ncbi:MAG: murein biosynthesis integral membrane protein MurJ [Magnetococcales bacterium]|nr:murein biosynthesis integral membrane protein MurJ [Magnetococcales bacterium]
MISFFTLLSRILGFVRDIVIARGFGAGLGADAFFIAQKLPNFLRRLFAEGAFNTAFVPVFSDYLADGDRDDTRRMMQSVFTMLFLAVTLVVALAQIFMPYLIMAIAPGFSDDPVKQALTVDLTRITFPYILFISLTALAGGILNSHRRFAIPAATPLLLNVAIISSALLLTPLFEEPATALAVGIFLGGLAQLGLQLPALARLGLPFRLRWDPKHPAIHRILHLMAPSILGVSVAQIGMLFDLFLASFLPEGSISYLYYADRMVEFPLGLIGIALGTAILPTLSAKAARNDIEGLRHDLDFALRLTLVVNLPATIGLISLREPILSLLFERGAFDAQTTTLAGQALFAYGIGLIAFSAIKVTAPAFYAMKDTRTPVRIAMKALAVNMVLNVVLMFPFQHAGLALSTSLAAFVNVGLLILALRDKVGYRFSPQLKRTALISAGASAVLLLFLELARIAYWSGGLSLGMKMAVLLPTILGGVVIYFGIAWLLRMNELKDLVAMVRRRKG